MFIKELKLNNFKSFHGDENDAIFFNKSNGTPGSGLNIFVGENNSGKSSVFEAVDFLKNGTKKNPEDIMHKSNPIHASVELTFVGNIEKTIDAFSQENKKQVFKKYVYSSNGEFELKLRRSTENIKQIELWNSKNDSYNNESGIDAPIKKLFEANFVWADTNPNEEAAFGSTTICGNLLKEIAATFTETSEYSDFRNKFNQIFNDDNSGLRKELLQIESRVKEIFSEQFSSADIKFHFDELKVESFFKSTTIKIDDGITTPMDEKGSGMQRAVALALLQVYAEELTKHPNNVELIKPFYLFIDEPEICLHPKGQEKLLAALIEISKTKQVFLATHSPYFLITQHLHNVGLYIFKNNGYSSEFETATQNKLFPWSPTWGEINFKAYKLATVELHNELYGYLQEKCEKFKVNEFDNWLVEQNLFKTKTWIKEQNGVPQLSSDVSLQTFIRNKIHHPENSTMNKMQYTRDELTQSINEMIVIVSRLSCKA